MGTNRSIGLLGATRIGVGAIVGGGILVLAGPAFYATGPSAILAFALNGLLALMTAMSFAEMVSAYPRSGGPYTFVRRVLSVRSAFGAGWVLWLAYIVAGVLYALGFGVYAGQLVALLFESNGVAPPPVFVGHGASVTLAILAIGVYSVTLIRRATGGGDVSVWGKVIVLGFLAIVGLWFFVTSEAGTTSRTLAPFMPNGTLGLLSAMGLSFIAFQGFDLVATVASEVKQPAQNIPRAMFLALGIAVAIYLPLLFVVATIGVGDAANITTLAAENPDKLMAAAVGHYMGPLGTWLVLIAAVLATLSALNANLLAASRVAQTMAMDRTLPWVLGLISDKHGTPMMAIYSGALAMGVLLFMVPDLSAAGAAASLIFLLSFALAHYTAYLARKRRSATPDGAYRSPLFPMVPVLGGAACVALSVFQAVANPYAGAIALVWLGLGLVLYRAVFAERAQVVDAAAEAGDAELVRLRGLKPLVLVPVHNPENAAALVQLASALAPPGVGKVLLLSVIREACVDAMTEIQHSQEPVGLGMFRAVSAGHRPEAMMTVAADPWHEIARVAEDRRCERVLLGLSHLRGDATIEHLETLLNRIDCDLSILRAPADWELDQVKRLLVPVGGQGKHDELRARLLAALGRAGDRHVHFLRVMSPQTTDAAVRSVKHGLERRAKVEVGTAYSVEVVRSDDVLATITERCDTCDLLVLGLQRSGRNRKAFGQLSLQFARQTDLAMILLGGRTPSGFGIWRP